MSSDEDGAQLMAIFQKQTSRNAPSPQRKEQPSVPARDLVLEHSPEAEGSMSRAQSPRKTRRALCVRVKPVENKDEYTYYEPRDEVEAIVREFSKRGNMLYEVRLSDGSTKQVSVLGKGSLSGTSAGVKAK
jgi:hypothetical protein